MQRKKYLSFYALIACGWIISAQAAETPEIEALYEKGQKEWNNGDMISAMATLKEAADGGHAAAQAMYAFIQDQADNDVEAAKYYRMSAEQENVEGIFGLANFVASGDGNVEKDEIAALQLFKRAAEKGHQQSIVIMAMTYINGTMGLTENDKTSPEALKWIKMAAEKDNTVALKRLEEAYRKGELGLPINTEEADRLQRKILTLRGIDPDAPKKRRRRN